MAGGKCFSICACLKHAWLAWPSAAQACAGLPETAVADEATWKMLMGPDAKPDDAALLSSGDENDEDVSEGTGIWLIGEQRWARKL
jgi:hypothetical protein